MKNFNRGQGDNDRRGDSSGQRRNTGGFVRRDFRDTGGRGSFKRGGQNSFSRPAMSQAICADCGESCEVPFKPISGKPVFCSNCFKQKDGGRPAQSHDRSFSKADFSSQSYSRSETTPKNNSSIFSYEQFKKLETKLDQILNLLELASQQPEVVLKQIAETIPKTSLAKKPLRKPKSKSFKSQAPVKKVKRKK